MAMSSQMNGVGTLAILCTFIVSLSCGQQSDETNLVQMNAIVHHGADRSDRMESTGAVGSIKLIVNSDARYDVAVNVLLKSLDNASFSRWQDVVVMRGNATEDSEPYTPQTPYGRRGLTYIDLKLNSYDLHGLSALYHHREHPRVKADVYLYIHDTVKVNDTFPSLFDSMSSVAFDEVRHPPLPSSNICAFGRGVVENYGTVYDTPVNKLGQIDIEFGRTAAEGVPNIVSFAKTDTVVQERYDFGSEDVYGTGFPRNALYYPSFGLTKYVFWGRHGDLTNDVQNNPIPDNNLIGNNPIPQYLLETSKSEEDKLQEMLAKW